MAYSVAHLNSPIIFSFAVFLNGKNVFKKRKGELYEKKTMKQNTYKENMRGVFFFIFSPSKDKIWSEFQYHQILLQ